MNKTRELINARKKMNYQIYLKNLFCSHSHLFFLEEKFFYQNFKYLVLKEDDLNLQGLTKLLFY